nr:hypothetical protein Itr_chr01CG06890 [Ipomoea trifida]
MVVLGNQTLPSPREDEASRTKDELNSTPAAQVDPTFEAEINLGTSSSSSRGENRDAPPGVSQNDFESSTTDQTRMPPFNPRPMSDTASILSILQILAKENKSHFKTIKKGNPSHKESS